MSAIRDSNSDDIFFLPFSSPWTSSAVYLCLALFSFFLFFLFTSRFEKNDILRIVRALAIFRPSLIALQMPLSLDDEIFVEKCFQRTLLVRVVFPDLKL